MQAQVRVQVWDLAAALLQAPAVLALQAAEQVPLVAMPVSAVVMVLPIIALPVVLGVPRFQAAAVALLVKARRQRVVKA